MDPGLTGEWPYSIDVILADVVTSRNRRNLKEATIAWLERAGMRQSNLGRGLNGRRRLVVHGSNEFPGGPA